ncbi:anti-anti-sigma factor [Micromonospora pattaloongensis]|uniref:Anti-anti-sigma factor n=1 Tax=Micromonospora pattaloongensis TaxID=405436 RepID=A0A1H3QQX1_9ACTN|nr:anti-anti-sigma factor [Micromonospora pattaloongensis]
MGATTKSTVPLVEVAITDDIDTAAVPALTATFTEILSLRPHRVVVDLAECRGLDAAGVGMLLDVHRRLWRDGALLTLRSPTPRLRRILDLARVGHVLHIAADDGETP